MSLDIYKEEIVEYFKNNQELVKAFLIQKFAFELNDSYTRNSIVQFLKFIYGDSCLISCSEIDNTPETIDKGQIIIRFRTWTDEFTWTLEGGSIYSVNEISGI